MIMHILRMITFKMSITYMKLRHTIHVSNTSWILTQLSSLKICDFHISRSQIRTNSILIPHFPIMATAFLHWAKRTENGDSAVDHLGQKPLQLHVFVLNSIFVSFLFFTLHFQSQGKKNTER